jgi:hypothetical protein
MNKCTFFWTYLEDFQESVCFRQFFLKYCYRENIRFHESFFDEHMCETLKCTQDLEKYSCFVKIYFRKNGNVWKIMLKKKFS